jgi:MFS family permease
MAPNGAPKAQSRFDRSLGVSRGHENYKWWALSCTSLGMLLAATNSGTLIIALPDLERSLHTSLLALVWVILAYLIAATVLVLTAGRLSDLFGRKRAYVGGFLLFALASLGAGFSTDATVLILWRILQGIGSAFLFANAAALVTDAFPHDELGLAMGTNTMVAAIGLAIGPVLGGALVAISWHWVFWFNVPLALLGAIWGALILRELAKRDHPPSYDLLGTATFVVGLTGLVLGVSRGGLSGWSDGLTLGSLLVAAVLLPAWVLIELRSRAPMLDLSLFANRLFAAATGAAFINGLTRFALMFLFVFYFQGAQGNSPIEAGVKLIPLAVGMLIASPLAGIYADRHGSRGLAALGMVVSAVGLAAGPQPLLAEHPLAGPRRSRLGHVQQPQHGGDNGDGPGQQTRDSRRRTHARAEHRGGAVDRLRARDRHLHDPQVNPFRGVLGPRQGPLRAEAGPLHCQYAHGALGARDHVPGGRRRLPVAPPACARSRDRRPERGRRRGARAGS